ncbi:MAG: ADOP family duplicated permease [Terriglobales bacterium]
MRADENRLREELASHLAALAAEFERQGLAPVAARRAARLKLGGEEQIRMLWHDARHRSWFEAWARDVRLAARSLRRSPGYAAAVIVTLALAIAANVAMFSVAWAFLLRPLPYAHPRQLAMIHGSQARGYQSPVSYPLFLAWRERNHSFSTMAAFTESSGVLTGSEAAEYVAGAVVSADFFSLLGVHPSAGRFFRAAEDHPYADAGTDAMVISHALFERRFGGSAKVLGSVVRLSGKAYTLVGVAPPGLAFSGASPDYWITAAAWFEPQAGQKQPVGEARNASFLWANVGRLRAGVSIAAATRDLDRISAARRGKRSMSDVDANAWIKPLRQGLLSSLTELLHLLWAGAGLILLIACANLAGLGLARGRARLPELRTRVALGARPRDLLRALLCESSLLAAAGCAAGCALAVPAVAVLKAQASIPGFVPHWDATVLVYTMALGVLAAVLIGCWPAWAAARGALSGKPSGAQRGRGVLVAAEIAVALLLVAAAALLGRSLYGLAAENPGFDPHQVLTASLTLPDAMRPSRRPQAVQSLLDRVRALPGVAAAGAGLELPWGNGSWRTVLSGHGMVPFDEVPVTPGYFETLRMHLLRGRAFTASDGAGAAPVVIVNQRLLQKLRAVLPSFPASGLGVAITPEMPRTVPRTIVGVVANVVTPGQWTHARLYLPYAQVPRLSPTMSVAIRAARGDPMALLPAVRKQLAAVDPDLALGAAQPLAGNRGNWAGPPEAAAAVAGAFGILALLLAATGLYGLMAYAVRQRQRELAVRVALGAQRRDLYRLVLGGAARLTMCGLLAGGAGLLLLRPALASQLYNLSPLDPASLIAAALLLASVALAAAWFPARHAARADPMRALRTE